MSTEDQPQQQDQQDAADALELRGRIALGHECQQFLKTSLGRYIQARANNERLAALEQLADVDPTAHLQIIALQSTVRMRDRLADWFNEIIAIGEQAEAAFVSGEFTD